MPRQGGNREGKKESWKGERGKRGELSLEKLKTGEGRGWLGCHFTMAEKYFPEMECHPPKPSGSRTL